MSLVTASVDGAEDGTEDGAEGGDTVGAPAVSRPRAHNATAATPAITDSQNKSWVSIHASWARSANPRACPAR